MFPLVMIGQLKLQHNPAFIRFTLIQIDTSLLIIGDGNGGEVINTLTNILNQNIHRYA